MFRVQIMGTYVLIITNLIWYFKVACPTTEITPSLKLKVIPTRSVASNRIEKDFRRISEKSDGTVPHEPGK